jgi:hypothetical protein
MSKKIALPECDNCADTTLPLKNCSRCKLVKYCSKPCQRQHWRASHNKRCVAPEDRKPSAAAESSDVPKCVICLEAFHDSFVVEKENVEYKLSADVKLKCGHKFHNSCALEAARESGGAAKCVICRSHILAGESFERVYYKNLLFKKAMFNAMERTSSEFDPLLFAAKRRAGELAAEVEKEVLEIANWDMLCEAWVNYQFLVDVFYLEAQKKVA